MAAHARSNLLIEQTRAAAKARNIARLAELAALIRRRAGAVVEGLYDVGEALKEVVAHKLYAAEGHTSLGAWLRAESLLAERTAFRLIAVARAISREHAIALGHERAYALLGYAEATAANDNMSALLAPDATIEGRPVRESSVRQINQAARLARAKRLASRPKSEAQRERARADAELERAIRAALRDAGFGRAEITLTRDSVRIELSRSKAERIADE